MVFFFIRKDIVFLSVQQPHGILSQTNGFVKYVIGSVKPVYNYANSTQFLHLDTIPAPFLFPHKKNHSVSSNTPILPKAINLLMSFCF